ncbi:hypothetical protein MRB53_016944 [Persea americana]|uniref:Uncharacterized protein n=1 Tax=Persea americana TaxID=3435 RepID=A0ACC2M3P0_PERAE|nr:hypothetical protein MRB53_016944 [Persea americana]
MTLLWSGLVSIRCSMDSVYSSQWRWMADAQWASQEMRTEESRGVYSLQPAEACLRKQSKGREGKRGDGGRGIGGYYFSL